VLEGSAYTSNGKGLDAIICYRRLVGDRVLLFSLPQFGHFVENLENPHILITGNCAV
jgi:hypothetical protein